MSQGFEGANLRAIATDAGLSTGALFANFENKAELFNALVVAEYARLSEALAKTPHTGEDVLNDLIASMITAYGFFWPQLRFAQALFSTDWTCQTRAYRERETALAPALAKIAGTLERGKTMGQIRQDLDTARTSRNLAALMAASLQTAIQLDQDLAITEAAMAETIKTLAKGWQP